MRTFSMKRFAQASLLIATMGLSLVACGKKEETVTSSEPIVDTTPVVVDVQIEDNTPAGPVQLEFDGTRSYLTGLPLDPTLVGQRPVFCMYENTLACLPHHNLDKAAIVYECPVEGSITRYMAAFDDWQNVNPIGNIRSCRTYYAHYAAEYDGIYFHWGESVFAKPFLMSGDIDDVDALSYEWAGFKNHAASNAFFRIGGEGEHTGFSSGEAMMKGINSLGYSLNWTNGPVKHWNFAADGSSQDLEDGTDVAVIKPYYTYNYPGFVYNAEDQLYYRYEFRQAEVDGESGNQYAVTNVVMQMVPSSYYKEENGANSKYLEFDLVGSGEGKYFTHGKMIDVTWTKADLKDYTHFYTMDGEELIMNQGKTWYMLIEDQYKENNKFYTTEEEYYAASN